MDKNKVIDLLFDRRLKFIVFILVILSINLELCSYDIEHIYYNEKTDTYYKENNFSYINSISLYDNITLGNTNITIINKTSTRIQNYKFVKPEKLITKNNLFGFKEPEILYIDYIKFKSKEPIYNYSGNETYLLHQKTFFFTHVYDVTNQFKK